MEKKGGKEKAGKESLRGTEAEEMEEQEEERDERESGRDEREREMRK